MAVIAAGLLLRPVERAALGAPQDSTVVAAVLAVARAAVAQAAPRPVVFVVPVDASMWAQTLAASGYRVLPTARSLGADSMLVAYGGVRVDSTRGAATYVRVATTRVTCPTSAAAGAQTLVVAVVRCRGTACRILQEDHTGTGLIC